MIKPKRGAQFQQCLRDSHLECRVSVRVASLVWVFLWFLRMICGRLRTLDDLPLTKLCSAAELRSTSSNVMKLRRMHISNFKSQWIGTFLARHIYRGWLAGRSSENRTLDGH